MLVLHDCIYKTTIHSHKLKRDINFYLDRNSFIWIDNHDLGYKILSNAYRYHRITTGGSFTRKPIICNDRSAFGFDRTCYRWLHQFYKRLPYVLINIEKK